jgi:hypothetical protein
MYFEGNAPTVPVLEGVFRGTDNVTVYYLPGATGWNWPFSGRPTVLWHPRALTNDPGFGIQTNQFGFNIHWARYKYVVVDASPSLTDPAWAPVSTNFVAPGGTAYFADPNWTKHPTRFYRIRSQ